jgi:SAM-dependent methyltransferase
MRRHSFDRDPHAYQQSRPPYPPQIYEMLTAECGLRPGSRVLEIGAGTGLATGELLARGASVVAVEPGRGLARVLTERFARDRLTVVEADFERADVPPGSFDLVVAATAFHWVDASQALPRIAEILAPAGWLAVWWTVFVDPQQPTPFRETLDGLYRRHLPHERRDPDHLPGPLNVDSWSAELRRGGWFGPVRVDQIRWTYQLTPERARLLWGSFPNVNELDPAVRAAFLDDLAGAVDRHGGTVADPYVTVIYRSQPVASNVEPPGHQRQGDG